MKNGLLVRYSRFLKFVKNFQLLEHCDCHAISLFQKPNKYQCKRIKGHKAKVSKTISCLFLDKHCWGLQKNHLFILDHYIPLLCCK